MNICGPHIQPWQNFPIWKKTIVQAYNVGSVLVVGFRLVLYFSNTMYFLQNHVLLSSVFAGFDSNNSHSTGTHFTTNFSLAIRIMIRTI